METLPDTVYLIPYPGQDDFIVWDLTPEPDGIYEDEGESYDPADAVKYIRADSLPQPSTEVPTVPGVYLIEYALLVDSKRSYATVEIQVCCAGWYEGMLLYFINGEVPALKGEDEFVDFLIRYSICEPTFTLIREDT